MAKLPSLFLVIALTLTMDCFAESNSHFDDLEASRRYILETDPGDSGPVEVGSLEEFMAHILPNTAENYPNPVQEGTCAGICLTQRGCACSRFVETTEDATVAAMKLLQNARSRKNSSSYFLPRKIRLGDGREVELFSSEGMAEVASVIQCYYMPNPGDLRNDGEGENLQSVKERFTTWVERNQSQAISSREQLVQAIRRSGTPIPGEDAVLGTLAAYRKTPLMGHAINVKVTGDGSISVFDPNDMKAGFHPLGLESEEPFRIQYRLSGGESVQWDMAFPGSEIAPMSRFCQSGLKKGKKPFVVRSMPATRAPKLPALFEKTSKF